MENQLSPSKTPPTRLIFGIRKTKNIDQCFATLYGKFVLCASKNVCKMIDFRWPSECTGIMTFPKTQLCRDINSCTLSFAHIFRCTKCEFPVHGKKQFNKVYRTVQELRIQTFTEQNSWKFIEFFRTKYRTFNNFP